MSVRVCVCAFVDTLFHNREKKAHAGRLLPLSLLLVLVC